MKKLFFLFLFLLSCSTTNEIKPQMIVCTTNNVVMVGEIVSRIGLAHLRIKLVNGHVVVVNRHDCRLI